MAALGERQGTIGADAPLFKASRNRDSQSLQAGDAATLTLDGDGPYLDNPVRATGVERGLGLVHGVAIRSTVVHVEPGVISGGL
jgi:hypothetical protein